MFRKLLATTAIVTIAAGGAYAAETPVTKENQTAERFLPNLGQAALASDLIGETVYASEAENAETIGEINDLIVGADGDVDAAIVGVGGFLGVGEKNVAVTFDSLKLVNKDGDRYVILATTKEELSGAPAFQVQAAAPAAPTLDTTAATPQTVNPTAPVESPATTGPSRDTLKSVDIGTISSDNVIGATVYSKDDQNVGEIGEVVMTNDGKIDAVVIDVGGFLGIGTKPVAIAFDALDFMADEGGTIYVYTTFTEDQLQAAANYVKDDYAKNRDIMLLKPRG